MLLGWLAGSLIRDDEELRDDPWIFLLSSLIWLPIVGGIAVLLLARRRTRARVVRMLIALARRLVRDASCQHAAVHRLRSRTAAMQFVERVPWIERLQRRLLPRRRRHLDAADPADDVHHGAGGDRRAGGHRSARAQYFAAFLILEGLMIGVFAALDAMLFYVFWEAMLIPMFIIIGVWGGPNRVYATIKFFLYTFLGSVFMLVALIYMYFQSGSMEILAFHDLKLNLTEQILIFVAFLLAFAVKVPMWPVHTWLPDAHVEAPTGGSVILAAIMLKMGGYGFLRFSLPMTPDASHEPRLADHRAVADRGGLHRLRRAGADGHEEADRLFVDRAHGLRHAGLLHIFDGDRSTARARWTGAALGDEGGMVQMISHGLISGAMFLCVGVLYDRMHSREIIADYGGVVNTMPKFAAFMVLFAMANAGLAGHLRLRRRVPGDPRELQGESLVCVRRRHHAYPGRGLHAVDGQARDLRRGRQRPRRRAEGRQRARVLMLGMLAIAPVLVLGLWPAPLLDVMHDR